MPTGYTAGILDGTTKDFKEFAKLCSRAFIFHLREEPINSEYKPREPSGYHLKAIKKAEDELNQLEMSTDAVIVKREKKKIIDLKNDYLKSIEEIKAKKEIMVDFLKQAKAYKPPTETHNGIAEFMIEQLEKTMDYDCYITYYTDQLKEIDLRITNVNADDIRAEIKIKAAKDIAYHTEHHEKELKGCREHNKWYNDFIESLP